MGQTLTISCGNRYGHHLVAAIREGNVDLVQRIVEARPKRLNKGILHDRQTPLHVAASFGQLEVLSLLLQRGAEANALNRNGQTPLMLAGKTGHAACLDALLKAGANILGFDCVYGRACLHYACRGGDTECVRLILDAARRGPVSSSWGLARFVNLKDCRGTAALHMAARMGHAPVLRLLLDNGALVSSTNNTAGNGPGLGSSPIHYAARGGSLECVRELLAWGADRTQRDDTGVTAFGIAMKYSNIACAAVLNPRVAEPLVWPSPWKFMSEGELEPEAKTVLEAALAQANNELDREIETQKTQRLAASKSSSRGGRKLTLASILAMPEHWGSRTAPVRRDTVQEDLARTSTQTPAENELPHASVVGDLPDSDNSDSIDAGNIGVQEMCCICFEQFCTIEVMDCGHQMCATCTLSLCCHNKPNPAIPYSPPPSCPFCRSSIKRLILARPKEALSPETPEKSLKQKLRRLGSKSKNSKGGSNGGKGSFTGSLFSRSNRFGSSRRLGASGRIADADWLDRVEVSF